MIPASCCSQPPRIATRTLSSCLKASNFESAQRFLSCGLLTIRGRVLNLLKSSLLDLWYVAVNRGASPLTNAIAPFLKSYHQCLQGVQDGVSDSRFLNFDHAKGTTSWISMPMVVLVPGRSKETIPSLIISKSPFLSPQDLRNGALDSSLYYQQVSP